MNRQATEEYFRHLEEIARLQAEASIYRTQAEIAIAYLESLPGDAVNLEYVAKIKDNVANAKESSVVMAQIL